jgi:hypothetical protein
LNYPGLTVFINSIQKFKFSILLPVVYLDIVVLLGAISGGIIYPEDKRRRLNEELASGSRVAEGILSAQL